MLYDAQLQEWRTPTKEESRLAHQKSLQAKKAEQAAIPFLEIVSQYKSYWINDPKKFVSKTKSKAPEKRLFEFVKYVFCNYQVSKQLSSFWPRILSKKPNDGIYTIKSEVLPINVDPIKWFICAAQGGSLYKEHARELLTKKEVHTLLTCPYDLTFEEAYIYSIAKTYQESDGLALRISRSKLCRTRITEFHKTVIYFFSKNVPDSIQELDNLLDFIFAQRNNPPLDKPPFTMSGQTLAVIRKKTQDWHWELRRMKALGNHVWEGHAIDDCVIKEKDGIAWHFNQIKTSKDLAHEGNVMHHCVYSYQPDCISSRLSIWSLSKEENFQKKKKVTIELTNSGRIVQAARFANGFMKPDERWAVKVWAKQNGLSLEC